MQFTGTHEVSNMPREKELRRMLRQRNGRLGYLADFSFTVVVDGERFTMKYRIDTIVEVPDQHRWVIKAYPVKVTDGHNNVVYEGYDTSADRREGDKIEVKNAGSTATIKFTENANWE